MATKGYKLRKWSETNPGIHPDMRRYHKLLNDNQSWPTTTTTTTTSTTTTTTTSTTTTSS